MDWTEILKNAGTPEPLGRDEAIRKAAKATAKRYEKEGGPTRAKGTTSRPQQQVSRKLLQERERKANG
jgi:hypothetical protein